MKACFAACVLVAALISPGPAFAQTKAKAENVPEIPFDSVPNFFKLPPDLYFGEGIGIATNSKGHVFVYTAAATRGCSSSTRTAPSSRRSARASTASSSRTRSASTREDNIWVVDEGTNMVIKFNPEGRVADGARPPAARPSTGVADSTPDRPGAGAEVHASAGRPTSAWERRATSSSPTATSTRAW